MKTIPLITNKTLFDIQQKYIDILKWLEDNKWCKIDSFRSSKYYQEQHDKGYIEIYNPIKINRDLDYIEMGHINENDLVEFTLHTKFKFKIEGNEETMLKWHMFLGRINNDHDKTFKIPKVFDDCYFETFYDNNKISVNFNDYHGWAMYGAEFKNKQDYYKDKSKLKPLEFIIPFNITYNIKIFKIK